MTRRILAAATALVAPLLLSAAQAADVRRAMGSQDIQSAIGDGSNVSVAGASLRTTSQRAASALQPSGNLGGLADVAAARVNLGLGTMAIQPASSVAITGGTATGLSNFSTGTTSTAGQLKFDGPAGTNRQILWRTGTSSNRWAAGATNDAEGGADAGSNWLLGAYSDSGSYLGAALTAYRALRQINIWPSYMASSRQVAPGGVIGHQSAITNTPAATSLTNPLSTTSGSATVSIAWPAHGLTTAAYVQISGASAVGGVTLSGWYPVAAVPDANTIRVTAGSSASSTATGGGTVSVQASYIAQGSKAYYASTTGAAGFDIGETALAASAPVSTSPACTRPMAWRCGCGTATRWPGAPAGRRSPRAATSFRCPAR